MISFTQLLVEAGFANPTRCSWGAERVARVSAGKINDLEQQLSTLREAALDTQVTLDTMLSDQNTYRFEGIYMDHMRERLYYHKEALAKLLEGEKDGLS